MQDVPKDGHVLIVAFSDRPELARASSACAENLDARRPRSVTFCCMKTVQHRFVSILSGIAFGFSAAFPLAAGLSKDTSRFPPWWGAADVTIAFLLAVLALAVLGLGQSRITKGVEEETYRAYRVLLHGIFVLLVVFAFFGNHIVWSQCLSGIAWRTWLLLYVL